MTAIAFILRSKTLHRQKQILEELVIVSFVAGCRVEAFGWSIVDTKFH